MPKTRVACFLTHTVFYCSVCFVILHMQARLNSVFGTCILRSCMSNIFIDSQHVETLLIFTARCCASAVDGRNVLTTKLNVYRTCNIVAYSATFLLH